MAEHGTWVLLEFAGGGLAQDERQVTWVVVGLQMHGGIVHVTMLLICFTWHPGANHLIHGTSHICGHIFQQVLILEPRYSAAAAGELCAVTISNTYSMMVLCR